MPSAERNGTSADDDDRSKQKSSSSKTKDLSHVPCKFFKVGSCTAGSSCPFSHNALEPGAQKDTCAWFVKGNCKFGHKCALAHILPGQSMAMDRKNKKAAQVAAGGSSTREKSSSRSSSSKKDQSAPRQQLLSGSTAPTRASRAPMSMPLKATISPSAPAPPLKDTDFTSSLTTNLDDDNAKLPIPPAQGKQDIEPEQKSPPPQDPTPSISPPGIPLGSPTAPRRPVQPSPAAVDYGPIGSPPRSAASPHIGSLSRIHANGFSPATSPNTRDLSTGFLSTSPFSAPGAQSMFAAYGTDASSGMRGGIAQSLGTGLAMQGRAWNTDYDYPHTPAAHTHTATRTTRASVDFDITIEYDDDDDSSTNPTRRNGHEHAVQDEDLEDFIPSSLSDLLTPEERSRRMSRSNSGQSPSTGGLHTPDAYRTALSPAQPGTPTNSGHRYSRSVPGTSLLGGGDIKSIWAADNNTSNPTALSAALPSSPPRTGGAPSSFKATLDAAHHSPGHSFISPTNASAAFLPGLHHHYINAKAKQSSAGLGVAAGVPLGGTTGAGRGMRNASNPLYPSGSTTALPPGTTSSSIGNYLHASGLSSSPSQLHTFTRPTPYDPSSAHPSNNAAAVAAGSPDYLRGVRAIPGLHHNGTGAAGEPHVLSPSTRALQAHAPGQSLPQGLAAGYSRIHALPPLPLASPGSGSAMGSPAGLATAPPLVSAPQEWGGSPSPNHGHLGALDGMFASMAYSGGASSRAGPPPVSAPGLGRVNAPPGLGIGLGRNISGGKNWQGTGTALSPLGGTVVSGSASAGAGAGANDDDLFDMDG